MPYATPARFIQSFGLDETTQLLADEQRLLTAELLQAALAEEPAWPEASTPQEQAAALDAAERLQRKLGAQSNFMDSYLRSVVTLPLTLTGDQASTLEECCLALARGSLADDASNFTERMETMVARWTAWLRDVAAGKVTLVIPGAEQQPASSFRVRHGQAKSNFFPKRSW